MLGNVGPFELLLILAIALLFFGPSKLPEIGRAVGKSIAEFKKSLREGGEDSQESKDAKLPPGSSN